MSFDELYFHRKRGLDRWERVGHPFDTLSVVLCIAWLVLASPSRSHLAVYAGLSAFSCLLITKDEPVHTRRCGPGEHWVHAFLFVVHPISLASLALLWTSVHPAPDLPSLPPIPYAGLLVAGHLVVAASFCLYQTLYWNLPWIKRAPAAP